MSFVVVHVAYIHRQRIKVVYLIALLKYSVFNVANNEI